MISVKSTLKKIKQIFISDKLASMLFIIGIVISVFTNIMENQPREQKALYDNNQRIIGYSVNGELFEFEVKELPKESKKLVEELQEVSVNVLLENWMDEPEIKAIQNNKPEVKLFKVKRGFKEKILYSQKCPSGLCQIYSNGTSIIYVDEEIYANKDLFIDVYIHEYIHAMSKGADTFDIYKNGELEYSIVKEGYTEYLKDVVVKEGGLEPKYQKKQKFNSAYEDVKKIASVIDGVKLKSGYPIMRSIFFSEHKNLMYANLGNAYEELNRLAENEPESEKIPALLWRMERLFG